jgi:hypothetical protein
MASTLLIETTWRLHDALSLIRSLQPHVKPIGFHTCLGGGVLNNGASAKDLDLYFLPMASTTGVSETAKLLSFLQETWGKPSPMRAKKTKIGQMERYVDARGTVRHRIITQDNLSPLEEYTDKDDTCYLHKLKYFWSGLRIDVFILGTAAAAAAPPVEVEAPATDPLINEDIRQQLLNTPPQIDWQSVVNRQRLTSLWGDSPLNTLRDSIIPSIRVVEAIRQEDMERSAQAVFDEITLRDQELFHMIGLNQRATSLDDETPTRDADRLGE